MTTIRSYQYNVNFMFLIAFFGNGFFERAIWMLYLVEKGYSLLQIGLLQSLVNISMFICEIPSGVFADRFGRKVSLIVGRLLIILYLIGMMFSTNFYMFAISFISLGVGMTFISGAEEALLYDSLKKDGKENEFSRYVGRYLAIITLVLAIAMGAGGFLKAISWSTVFIVSVIFQIFAIIVSLLLKEISFGEAEDRQTFASILKDATEFLKMNGATRMFIIGIALYTGVTSTFYMFTQELFNQLGYAVYLISLFFGIESLLSAYISEKAHVIEKKFSPKSVLLASVVITGVFFVFVLIEVNVLLLLAFFVISLIYNLFSPVSYSVVNKEIPSEQRATLLSVMSFITSTVMFVLFPILGYVADKFGASKLLSIVGFSSMILVWACLAYFYRAKEKQIGTEENATTP
ncbi:MFS transporter [Brevibacillus thermoruber]|uniref:MFS transporter n=1 Tax=Brevibacillus thermoruber TaxID=33942 RepID=A0A9X3TUM0_9BACL|nr:MFS transporter [Brevibacillus thermoruber]MDA5110713.1 MFS transporter [Brevibacillus thermoruber]